MTAPVIALVGTYPPPPGGVPVHIKRLFERLKSDGISVFLYTPSVSNTVDEEKRRQGIYVDKTVWWGRGIFGYWGNRWLLRKAWRCPAKVIHFHDLYRMSLCMFVCVILRKRLVITAHDQMILYRQTLATKAQRWFFKKITQSEHVLWIAVSGAVKNQLVGIGVAECRISVIPAFLPAMSPVPSQECLPVHLQRFLNSHNPVITTYAWQMAVDSEGCEIHCLEQCVTVIASFKREYPGLGLVISIPVIGRKDLFDALRKRISVLGLGGDVLILEESIPDMRPLWQSSSVYLRATTTDGDALSVREALALGVPVVASDACDRPEGVLLFKTHDAPDMARAIRMSLDGNCSSADIDRLRISNDYYQGIRAIYDRALKL